MKFSRSERIRAQRVSRKFAETICNALGKNDIPVYKGAPIRTVIYRGNRPGFVVPVLKYNAIPTRILIETANLKNKSDLANIRNYKFREKYARALVEGIIDHFDNMSH